MFFQKEKTPEVKLKLCKKKTLEQVSLVRYWGSVDGVTSGCIDHTTKAFRHSLKGVYCVLITSSNDYCRIINNSINIITTKFV